MTPISVPATLPPWSGSEDNGLSVSLDNGKSVELDPNHARHIEYGYAAEQLTAPLSIVSL